MIIDAVVSVVIAVLHEIISLFPLADSSVLSAISSYTSTFRIYATNASWMFPIDTLFLCFSTILIVESSILGFKLIRWLASNLTGGILK